MGADVHAGGKAMVLKNEARLYARVPAEIEIKIGGCAYWFTAPHSYTETAVSRARLGTYLPCMHDWIDPLLALLALPRYGLTTLFLAAFISATLLPVGSEPILFGLLRLNPDIFWSAIVVATIGNTLGGALDWWMGYGAHQVVDKYHHSRSHVKAIKWLERLGPKACLLSWLPIVGDPLCAVAGWLKMPFWPCVGYMLVGKFLRYVTMTVALLWVFPG
jgi:membrane protein YqaA with SNARE-associated domain